MIKLTRKDLIMAKNHEDWGTWRITKTPTENEDWYHIRGDSGERVLFQEELNNHWDVVN